MAKAIAAGRELPLFFWRQSYMGVMTSYIAAPLMHAMSGAFALRIASTIEVLAGIIFYWLALRVGPPPSAATANVVALWLAIGPAYLMQFSIAPIGGEQMFVLSAIIFWFAVRTGLARNRDWFILGLLAGFGWWIHQGIVFALAAAVIVAILRSDWWRNVRTTPLRRPPLIAIILGALIVIDLILGAIVSLGFEAPAFFLFDPLLEPLIALLLLIAATVILSRADGEGPVAFLPAGPSRSAALRMTAYFALGALIAYSPVIIGTMSGLVPDTYGLSVPTMPLHGVVEHVVTFVSSDLWLFIGAAASIVIVPFFIVAMLRRPRLDMPLITIILCTIFYLFSQRAHPGTMRYIVSALPMVYAFAANEMFRLRWGGIAVAAVTLALLVPRVEQIRDVATGRGEYYAGLPGDFDPRPVLRDIESQHYTICYADYWIAYKLQWVSDERVRFIPYRSLDRTRATSRALHAAPGPKCFVDKNGRVTVGPPPLSAAPTRRPQTPAGAPVPLRPSPNAAPIIP
jgi:hypothetical protein